LPSAALGKAVFAECPRKGTRQSVRHSAKALIPVVITYSPPLGALMIEHSVMLTLT
jgi:hypothetical protein